jgi:hypothetical protein
MKLLLRKEYYIKEMIFCGYIIVIYINMHDKL